MPVPCGACGEANRDDARFCAACGTALARRCSSCERELSEVARFCDWCGAPVGGPVDAPAAPAGARKLVTVLFADLVGSTTTQESMDPEAVRAANTRAYAEMRAAVQRNGGTVVKFVGDGMMAVFGVPDVAEDDAVHAIAAAAALRAAFGSAMRVGVNTGEVVVADGDSDVMGDTVNVAARLEHDAPAGGVLVGPETYRLTRHAATFEERRDLQVKGRSAPVEARVLRELGPTTSGAPSVFVGRESELATLVGAFSTAEMTGRARLATVVGSPGVGKSRLLAELQSVVANASIVLAARCFDTGAASFEPIADVARQALAQVGGLQALPIDGAEQQRVELVIDALTTGGAPGTPQETFWAVRRLIQATARTKPVLLVLDDLHWAEPVLLDLVEHLAEWLAEAPVLLVAAGRPELREIRPSLAGIGGRAATVVSLEGLPADATERLAADLLGAEELPADAVARIVAATDGNPLFVREMLRMLVDDRVLLADGTAWQLAVDVEDIELPSTISALLAARLDRLPADERTVLERASVLGQDVVAGALNELVPATVRPRLPAIIEALRRKELLEPAGDYWIDEPLLRFHHVLIRDAAYRRLLKAARADLHERAARWLAAKTGAIEEHDELIGFHLEQSHLSRRDLGDVADVGDAVSTEAGTTLGRAAARALDRDDLTAAATLSGRALTCLPPGHLARADLLIVRCEASLDSGDITAAIAAVGDLADAGRSNERLRAWATVFRIQLDTLTGAADFAEAEPLAAAAGARLAELRDSAGAAKAHRVRALVLARAGRIADTEAALDLALTAARDANDRRQISGVLAAAPLAALWGPSPVPRAGGRCLDVVRLLRITTGAREVEAISMRCQAVLEALRGREDAARTMLGRAHGMLEDLGLRRGLVELDLYGGFVELIVGDPAAATLHLRRAHDGFTAMGLVADAGQAAAFLARALLMEGDVAAASELADTAGRLGDTQLKTAVTWRAVKAEILAARGDLETARELVEAAVRRAESTDALIDHADALAALAAVLRAGGDTDGAQRAEQRAMSLYELKGATACTHASPDVDRGHKGAETLRPTLAVKMMRAVDASIARGDLSGFVALMAPGFVLEDRRRTATLRYATAAELAAGIELFRGGVARSEVLATRGETLVLSRTIAGTDDFEIEWLTIGQVDARGKSIRGIQFDPDDLDEAMAELDRLAAVHAVEPNRASRCLAAVMAMQAEGRWDDFRAAHHPDLLYEDRRPGPHDRRLDRDEAVMHSQADPSVMALQRYEIVATRGQSFVLSRQVHGGDDFAVEVLVVGEFDEDRLCRRLILFNPEDLPAAVAELEWLASASVAPNRAIEVAAAIRKAIVERRWEDFQTLWHPDVAFEDRRSVATIHDVGPEDMLTADVAIEGVFPLTGGVVLATRGERAALLRVREGNGQFDDEYFFAFAIDDSGRVLRAVQLDADDIDAARQELDLLAVDPEQTDIARSERQALAGSDDLVANRAVKLASRLGACVRERRWDDLAELFTPDFVQDDRRRSVVIRAQDRSMIVQSGRAIDENGQDSLGVLLETRGDSLALYRVRQSDEHFANEFLWLLQVDEDERAYRGVAFDVDDIDGARAELHRLAGVRASVTLGTSSRLDAADRLVAILEAARDGRWDDLRAAHHPAFVLEDRRGGPRERTLPLESAVQHASMDPTLFWLRGYEILDSRSHAVLVRQTFGNDEFDLDMLCVSQYDDVGLCVRSVLFEPDDVVAATAELDRMTYGGSGRVTLASLNAARTTSLMAAGRWDEFRVMLHPTFELEDRRPGPVERAMDLERSTVAAQAAGDVGLSFTAGAVLATRGELLALIRHEVGDDNFEDEWLIVHQVDRFGRAVRAVFFHPTGLDDAVLELDRLAAQHGIVPHPPVPPNQASLVSGVAVALMDEGRWDELRFTMRDDFDYQDRRPISAGTVSGADATLTLPRRQYEAGLRHLKHEVIATRGDNMALLRHSMGNVDFEDEWLSVTEIDADGRSAVYVAFGPNELHDALAELDSRARLSTTVETLATVHAQLITEVMAAGRMDLVGLLLHPAYEFEDRRPGPTVRTLDLHGSLETIARVTDIGMTWDVREVLATRGELLSLLRLAVGSGDFRDEWLGVHQLDRYGREVRSRFFAPTDLGAALEELDHLASEQAVLERSGVRPNRAALLTLAAAPLAEEGRLDELRARMAPGLMMEDRRPVLTDRFVDANRTIEGLRIVAERGLHVDTAIVDTRGDRLALVRYGYGSASFVEESLVVVEYDEQYRTCRSIQFPSDDPKSATAELDRLAGEHPVVRAIRYGISLASAGRWDDYAAQMHPGYRYLDRRKGVRTPDGGPDTTVGIVRVGIEELGFEQVVHLVDSRGDGVALVRHQEAQPSGFVSDALLVIQLDGDGLFELVVQFDADDLAAATAELDRVASLALGTERLDPSI